MIAIFQIITVTHLQCVFLDSIPFDSILDNLATGSKREKTISWITTSWHSPSKQSEPTIVIKRQNRSFNMSGGNWKDLLKAAGAGNLQLMEYHLKNGVDPNYQHPEYFTSPVFEAIRGGQLEALRLLSQHGGSLTETEESTDMTPLEVAMEARQHAVVDFLLTKLDSEAVKPYLKRIAMPLQDKNVPESTMRLLQTRFLEQGHRLHLIGNSDSEHATKIVNALKDQTKNLKVEIVPKLPDVEETDVFLYCATSADLRDEEERLEKVSAGRTVVIFNSAGTGVASLLLGSCSSTTTAIKLHDSWLDQLTARWWLNDWVDTIIWMATDNDTAEICGKIHPYNRSSLDQRRGGIL
jgi:uncharacterized protein